MKIRLFRVLPLAVLVAALLVGTGPASAQQQVKFKSPERYPTGNPNEAELTSVTNADFDGKNGPDLAVTNTGGASFSVFLNKKKGNGKFGDAITTPVPCPDGTPTPCTAPAQNPRPMEIVSADFNRDGVADIAVTSPPNGGVFVFFGNGDGTFTFQQFYATGTRAFGITAADLNGDHRTDLVITNLGSRGKGDADLARDTISVLLNNPPVGSNGEPTGSDGTFQPAVNYPAGDSPSSVTAADLEGDGDLDLAVTNDRTTTTSDDISTYINDGAGNFTPGPDFESGSVPKTTTGTDTRTTGDFPTAIANADFNGDDKPDLVVANLGPDPDTGQTSNGNDTVSVLLNTTSTGGTLSFTKTDYPALDGPRAVTVADFDLDGNLDFAVPYQNNDAPTNAFISVYLNDGNGAFDTRQDIQGGVDSPGITSADFDGNNKPDLAAPDRSTTPDSVLVSLNTTNRHGGGHGRHHH